MDIDKIQFGKFADNSFNEVYINHNRGNPNGDGVSGWRYVWYDDDFRPEITRSAVISAPPYSGGTVTAPSRDALIDMKINGEGELFALLFRDSTWGNPDHPYPFMYYIQVMDVERGNYLRTIELRETFSGGGTPSHYGCHMPYGWWADYTSTGWPVPGLEHLPYVGGPESFRPDLSAELLLSPNRIAINAPYIHANESTYDTSDYFETPYVQTWDYEGNLIAQIDRSSYHVFPSSNPNNDFAAMPLGAGYSKHKYWTWDTDNPYQQKPVDPWQLQPALFDSEDNLYFCGGVDEWDFQTQAAPEPYLGRGAQTVHNFFRYWDGQLENAATCYSANGSKAWDYTAKTSMSGRLFATGISINPGGYLFVQIKQNLFNNPDGEWAECKEDPAATIEKAARGPSMFYFDYTRTALNGGAEALDMRNPLLYSRTEFYTPWDMELHYILEGESAGVRPMNYRQRAKTWRGHDTNAPVPYPHDFYIWSANTLEPDYRVYPGAVFGLIFGNVAPSPEWCASVHQIEIDADGNEYWFSLPPSSTQSGPRGVVKYERNVVIPLDHGAFPSSAVMTDPFVGVAFKQDPARMYTIRQAHTSYGSPDFICEYDISPGVFKITQALRLYPEIDSPLWPEYLHHLHPLTGTSRGAFG